MLQVGNGGPGCLMVDLEGKVVAKSGVQSDILDHAVMSSISKLCEINRIKEGKSFL